MASLFLGSREFGKGLLTLLGLRKAEDNCPLVSQKSSCLGKHKQGIEGWRTYGGQVVSDTRITGSPAIHPAGLEGGADLWTCWPGSPLWDKDFQPPDLPGFLLSEMPLLQSSWVLEGWKKKQYLTFWMWRIFFFFFWLIDWLYGAERERQCNNIFSFKNRLLLFFFN